MKKLLPLICLLALFACNEKNTPSTPDKNTGKDTSTDTKPTSDFSVYKQSVFVVKFTNKSTGATSYEWDFGDGTTSTEENPVHDYKKAGTYSVTLAAKNSAWRAETTKKFNLTAPTKCYVTGVCFEKVGKSNMYYRAKMEDCGAFLSSKKTWFNTSYTKMLNNSTCPYDYIFQNKVELSNLANREYYTVYVYWSNNTSKDGTQILKQNIYRDTEMYSTYPSSISKFNDAKDTKITVYYEWE